LIKLAIKDEIGPFKPIYQINFSELELTLQNSLKNRISKLEITNTNEIIEFILKELVENQSLITMSKV